MKMLPIVALSLSVGTVACAKRPDAIVPVDIPIAAYTNLSCQALASELVKERSTLASLSKQQNEAATGDAVGVFLIGVPASSTFGGDKEGLPADSYIKRFTSQSSKVLRLYQYNPDEGEQHDLEFDADTVFSVHKIVFKANA